MKTITVELLGLKIPVQVHEWEDVKDLYPINSTEFHEMKKRIQNQNVTHLAIFSLLEQLAPFIDKTHLKKEIAKVKATLEDCPHEDIKDILYKLQTLLAISNF